MVVSLQGVYERVLNIFREEGGVYGGSVVQDALEVLNNVLRAGIPNKRLFRYYTLATSK